MASRGDLGTRRAERLVVRALEPGEEPTACRLVRDTFGEFEADGYSSQGVESFQAYASPEAMARRLALDHFALGAFDADQLVGVIEIRELRHVSLLFVAGSHHRQGIARRLFEQAVEICRKRAPALERITVNSSRYAVPVYARLGFVPTGPQTSDDGILFTPMMLALPRIGGARGRQI